MKREKEKTPLVRSTLLFHFLIESYGKCLAFRINSRSLELAFANRSLRQLCENEIRAKRLLGDEASKKLKHRLADLHAATSIKDISTGKIQFNGSSKAAEIIMEIGDGYRIFFCPNHNKLSNLESGQIDWERVSRIKILKIEK